MWLARDKNGELYFYPDDMPDRDNDCFMPQDDNICYEVNMDSFPEVTWKKSPVEVELKIKEIKQE